MFPELKFFPLLLARAKGFEFPEVVRTLIIATVTAGLTMYGTVQVMSTEIKQLKETVAGLREEIRELRHDLKSIQVLAAERGKTIPELERRIQALEDRKR